MAQKQDSHVPDPSEEKKTRSQFLIGLISFALIIAAYFLVKNFSFRYYLFDGYPNRWEKLLFTIAVIAMGSAGIFALVWSADQLISALPTRSREAIRPYIFMGPALVIMAIFIVYPALVNVRDSFTSDIVNIDKTFSDPEQKGIPPNYLSEERIIESMATISKTIGSINYLINAGTFEVAIVDLLTTEGKRDSSAIVYTHDGKISVREKNDDGVSIWVMKPAVILSAFGFQNYRRAFSEPDLRIAYKNSFLWLLIGTSSAVGLGLLFALLLERTRYETLAKILLLLSFAIPPLSASFTWKLVYIWNPLSQQQIGLLNAIYLFFCRSCEPQSWLRVEKFSLNMLLSIVVIVWMMTGFCTAVFLEALKQVPDDLIESGRQKGYKGWRLLFRVIVPAIYRPILLVTIVVFILIYGDHQYQLTAIMTGGQNATQNINLRMIQELFSFNNSGHASALTVILLVFTLLIIVFAVRYLFKQETADGSLTMRQRSTQPTLKIPSPLRLVGLLMACLWVLPILGLLITSLRSNEAARTTGWWVALNPFSGAADWSIDFYQDLFPYLMDPFLDMLFINIPAVLLPIIMAAMVAYALAWMNFRGRNWVVGLVGVALFSTSNYITSIHTLLRMRFDWHLTPFVSEWLIFTAWGLPMGILLLYFAISRFPKKRFEVARLQGKSHPTIFRNLILPFALPTIVAFAMMQFFFVYSNLGHPIFFRDYWVFENSLYSSGASSKNSVVIPLSCDISNHFVYGKSETQCIASVQNSPTTKNRYRNFGKIRPNKGTDEVITLKSSMIFMVIPLLLLLLLQGYFVRGFVPKRSEQEQL